MNIARAKTIKVGDIVRCPADRGDVGFSGRVEYVPPADCELSRAFNGDLYIWITVRGPRGHNAVWPSNRLG